MALLSFFIADVGLSLLLLTLHLYVQQPLLQVCILAHISPGTTCIDPASESGLVKIAMAAFFNGQSIGLSATGVYLSAFEATLFLCALMQSMQ